ncbi:hypothetical protein Nepgr_032819 [Nepenthes gracilis]|uniref:VOC domain-containing protein n=1 Tax=Nepenthes gracilis TaxID=150966 RepID=A0AAD3Y8K8_NEPGR|nr:hypothetical protein Nepgr_032819 [Nepenthes gracilis]
MAHEVHNGAENGGAKAVSFSAFKPQLFVQAPKAADAVQFYKAAFGAEEVSRTMHPKRKAEQDQPLVLSAELKLCSSIFSVSDISDESSSLGAGFAFCLETDDVEAAIGKALAAGAVAEGEVTEGEGAVPVSKVKDPYGFVWMFCSSAKSCGDAEA